MIFEPLFFCASIAGPIRTIHGLLVFMPTLDHESATGLPLVTLRGCARIAATALVVCGGPCVVGAGCPPFRACSSCCATDDCSTGADGWKTVSGWGWADIWMGATDVTGYGAGADVVRGADAK